MCPQLLPVMTLASSWALLVSVRKGLTWVDVLEQGLPDGVLQGACVLGGREVFIGQIGLMDFPFEPGRRQRSRLLRGWISVPMLRALQPPSGQGHVCQVCWAQFKCLLVPLPTPLATGLSFLIFIMDSMTAPVFQACCEDYMA